MYGGKDKAPAMIAAENTGGYGVATLAKLYRELSYPNLYVRRQLDTYTQKWMETIVFDQRRVDDRIRQTQHRLFLLRVVGTGGNDDGHPRLVRVVAFAFPLGTVLIKLLEVEFGVVVGHTIRISPEFSRELGTSWTSDRGGVEPARRRRPRLPTGHQYESLS
jgi:hypothetical protein